MARSKRKSRKSGANWRMAFGSIAFLLVWFLGLASGVAFEHVFMRACVAAFLGAMLGSVVGMTAKGLRTLADTPEPEVGKQVDFTVAGGDDELSSTHAVEDIAAPVPSGGLGPLDDFQPIDYKQVSKQVHGLINE